MNDIHIDNSVYKNYNPVFSNIFYNSDTELFKNVDIITIINYE